MRVPVNYSGASTSSSLTTHMALASFPLALCAIITPTSGSAIAMTTSSSNLTGLTGYSGVTFRSTTGILPSKLETSDGMRAADMEADVILAAAGITEADILAGKWQHAAVKVFYVNPEDLTMGQLIIPPTGYVGNIINMGQYARIVVRGINHALNSQMGKVVRTECDAQFGDSRCGLDLSALGYVKTGTLTTVTGQTVLIDTGRTETADYFVNGLFTFTSGSNNGYTFEIDNWTAASKTFTLRQPTPYTASVGDTYSAKRGCQKRFTDDCVTKFSNAVNFRGFPFVPGIEKVNRLP